MDLSIIVPVYNMASGDKLRYCLNSLVNQTYSGEYEIIAVDDCSTDNSLEIIREFEKTYPGKVVGVASPENRRQGGARNLGLKASKGRFIGFMDADDWVQPDLYESMMSLAEKTGADVVGSDMCRVYEHTMVPTERESCNFQEQTGVMDDERRHLMLQHPGPLGTKIYERHIFFDPPILFPEKICYEDNALANEIAMRIRHFEHISEAKIFYYQHSGSTTHSISKRLCEDRIKAMRIMLDYAKANGSLERFHEDVEWNYANLFYRNTLFSYMQGDFKKELRFVRDLGREMTKAFPDFRSNPEYIKNVDSEQKRFINVQLKSTILFFLYYKLLWTYRRLRYGKKQNKGV